MARRKPTPYKIPTKWKGDAFQQVTHKFDAAFHQAIAELAADESAKWGSKHGVAPVLMNLALNNNDYFRDQRARLRKRYKELKQQEINQREQDHQEVAAEFS